MMTWLALWMGCATPPPIAPAAPATPPPPTAAATRPGDGVERWLHATPADHPPVILLLHGLGDTPQNLAPLLDGYPGPARVLAPAGPMPWGQGTGWLDPPGRDERPGDAAQELVIEADAVRAWLDERVAPTDRVAVTGFSQGAMLAFTLALRHPDRFLVAVPIAGALPAGLVPGQASAAQARLPIRAVHGTADPVLPYERTRLMVDRLSAAGFDAALQPFDGVEHQVPQPVREAVYGYLRASLSPGAPGEGPSPGGRPGGD